MKPQWQRRLERREWTIIRLADGRTVRAVPHDLHPRHPMPPLPKVNQ